jgi:catechol 2,3-dioxygenase-like lactoylglutathione lyase family enzyme
LLLRPLPVRDPRQLVNLLTPGPKPGSSSCNQASTRGNCDDVFSYPMFRDLERVQNVFSGMAGHRLFGANLLGPVDAPVNTLGIRRVMFAVDDIDAVVARMRAHGAELIGEMQCEDTYRLCIR